MEEVLQAHHAAARKELAHHSGLEVDTAGDGFFATFDGPAIAVRCALSIIEAVRPLGLEIRAGVHTGEVETVDAKVGGIGVTIGARIAALAAASEVLASSTVRDLTAGSGLVFEDAGGAWAAHLLRTSACRDKISGGGGVWFHDIVDGCLATSFTP